MRSTTSGDAMFLRLFRLFRILGRELLVLWHACRNPSTPPFVKLIAIVLALYVMSPIDLVSDLIPVLGWLDDVTLLAFGIPVLLKLVPQQALNQAQNAADGWLARMKLWYRRS
jgi:uncharacterized membrane protein YkvA (DUF1232 family)